MDQPSKLRERERLADLITEWNANRLELFEISMPDENLEFHGVMRFFFQDEGAKVATKCIRVSSMETTNDVIETLVEKFRPDMKMLTNPTYYLYELSASGDERALKPTEHPLLVQLNWSKDDREGRFLLRNANAAPTKLADLDAHDDAQNFKRKLSKREKKEQKKKSSGSKENDSPAKNDDEETTSVFTRTKSNSEAVMRRRRQMKLENKFMEIKQQGDEGGLLKVYGDTLNPDVPYKSLLLSVTDTAAYVVREMLDKYGLLMQENPDDYCLVQVFNAHAGEIGGGLRPQEHLVENDECPLAILQSQVSKGNITFHVRRRDGRRDFRDDKLPHLLELNLDGSDMKKPKKHLLHLNITEVGSIASPSTGQHLRLIGPTILPHHAVIAHISGVVTVTPTSREAETYVEGQRISDTTVIQHGKIVRFGHHHAFRFVDPKVEERLRRGGGERIEDFRVGSGQAQPPPSENGPPAYTPRLDDVLPAGLEFRDESEENFLHSIVTEVTEGLCQFKLAPAYAVYLATRYRVDRIRPGAAPEEHFGRVQAFASKVAYFIRDAAARCRESPQDLAFWMSNASEVLHFFKQDRDIGPASGDGQDVLTDTVQDIFRDLVFIMQSDLNTYMPSFLVESDDDDAGNVLHVLSSAMALLRRCRVNAALTIQLFSQLFHFINMWLFNKLVMEPHLRLLTRQWGTRIKRRLGKIEAWAEKQGLELAADCHLSRISQAAHLLQSSKWSRDDVANISATCSKLNSLQIRALLTGYMTQAGEPRVPPELVENLVAMAAGTADEQARAEGREVRLEEDVELQLPFLVPDDGYSCDVVKDVPPGLQEFLQPLVADGLCRLTPLPSQSGAWTVFMPEHENNQRVSEEGTLASLPQPPVGPAAATAEQLPLPPPPNAALPPHMQLPNQTPDPGKPEVITIFLNKINGSMGLSIVAAKGENQPEKGIYIRTVVPGGAAASDGRLQQGDQLLEVDGRSLVGLSQELAAEYMKDTKQTVRLVVAKQSAIYHGLATFLSQSSPMMQMRGKPGSSGAVDGGRGGPDGRLMMAPFQQPLQSSKSTPLLNVTGGSYGDQASRQPALGIESSVDLHSKSTVNLRTEPGIGAAGGIPSSRSQMLPAPPGPYGSGSGVGNYDSASRSTSHPELPATNNPYADQPNYQNYPSGPDYRQQQPPIPQQQPELPGGSGVVMRHPSSSGSDVRASMGMGMRPGSQYDLKGPGFSSQQQPPFRPDMPQRPRSEFVDHSWYPVEQDDGTGGSRAGGQPIYQNQGGAAAPALGSDAVRQPGRSLPEARPQPSGARLGLQVDGVSVGLSASARFDPAKKPSSSSSMHDDQDLPPPPQSLLQPQYNYENQGTSNRYEDNRPTPQQQQQQAAPWSQQQQVQKQPFGAQPRAPENSSGGRPYDGSGTAGQFGAVRDPRSDASVPEGVPPAGSYGMRAAQQQPSSPGYNARGPPSPGYQQQGPSSRPQFGGSGMQQPQQQPGGWQPPGQAQGQPPPQSPPFTYHGRLGSAQQPDAAVVGSAASSRSATLQPAAPTAQPSGYGQQQMQGQRSGPGQQPGPGAAPVWQREDEERRARQIADESVHRRDELIAELQIKPRRTADEDEKLRRLLIDQEFERRAQEASHRKETSASDDERLPGGSMQGQSSGSSLATRTDGPGGRQEQTGQRWGPPGSRDTSSSLRGGAVDVRSEAHPASHNHPESHHSGTTAAAVKLETIPSKTIVFKPAYRDEPIKRDAERPAASVTFKPAVKPSGSPTSPRTQQRNQTSGSQLSRDQGRFDSRGTAVQQLAPAGAQQQRAGASEDLRRQSNTLPAAGATAGPTSLSHVEKEVLRLRLDEELKDKQRREDEERRRSVMMQPPPTDDIANQQDRWRLPPKAEAAPNGGQQMPQELLRRDSERESSRQPFFPGGSQFPPGPSDRRQDSDGGSLNASRSNGFAAKPTGPGASYPSAVSAAAPPPPDRNSSFQAQQRYNTPAAAPASGYVGITAPQPYGGAVSVSLSGPQPYGGVSGSMSSSQPPHATGGPGPQQPAAYGGPGPQQPAAYGGPGPQQPVAYGGPGPQQPAAYGGPGPQQPAAYGGPGPQQPAAYGGPGPQRLAYGGPGPQQPAYGGSFGGQQQYAGPGAQQQQQQSAYSGAGAPYDQRYGGSSYDRRSTDDSSDGRRQMASSASSDAAAVAQQKKSVSFNSNLETEIPTYAAEEATGGGNNYQNFSGGAPPLSGYGVATGRYVAGDVEPQFQRGPAFGLGISASVDVRTPERDIAGGGSSPPNSVPTPGVIGTHEVYRDPRMRIEAQRRSQSGSHPEPQQPADRLSFRDKMKFFASTAGENTPQEKPRSSKTQRLLEDHLMYNSDN